MYMCVQVVEQSASVKTLKDQHMVITERLYTCIYNRNFARP